MTVEGYLRELAYQLRWRRIKEDEVVDILREVSSEVAESQQPPEAVFGQAKDYAENFAHGKTFSRGYIVASVGIGTAVAAAGGRAIFSLLAGVPSELWVSVTSLVLAAVIIFVALGLGAHIDKRLPAEIRDPSAH